jgi:hypothetical protein
MHVRGNGAMLCCQIVPYITLNSTGTGPTGCTTSKTELIDLYTKDIGSSDRAEAVYALLGSFETCRCYPPIWNISALLTVEAHNFLHSNVSSFLHDSVAQFRAVYFHLRHERYGIRTPNPSQK